LKLREWVLDWMNRPEDWVLAAEGTQRGRRVSAEVVLSQEGLAILVRQASSASNSPTLRYALVAAPHLVGVYSGRQQSKLSSKPTGGQLQAFLTIAGEPRDGDFRGNVSVGAGWQSHSGGAPYSMRLELAPVAFVAAAPPRHGQCRVEQGMLSPRSEADDGLTP